MSRNAYALCALSLAHCRTGLTRQRAVDVQDNLSSEESDDGTSSATPSVLSPSSGAEGKLSKKAKARRRAAERKASKSTLTSPQHAQTNGKLPAVTVSDLSEGAATQTSEAVQEATTALQENVVQPVSNLVDSTAQHVLAPSPELKERAEESFTSTPYTRSEVEGSSSDLEDDGSEGDSASDDDAAEVLAAAPLSENGPTSPLSPTRHSRSRSGSRQDGALVNGSTGASGASTGADHQPATKWTSAITRTLWTFLMLFGFIAILLLGHAYVIMLVFFLQASVYRELTALFDIGAKAPLPPSDEQPQSFARQHSAAYTAAKEKKRAERDRYSKTISWYFFAATNYFLYGETIIYYFKHIVLVDAYFIPFAQHHRFISFMLYTLGFVGFVTTLKRDNLRRQFGLFGWIHMSVLLVLVSTHFVINNILEGMIWFFLPASLVICNDIWAYICGMAFGKTQLIKLSPKKTVEGFVGALFMTIIFGYLWATLFMRYPYMICPCRDLGKSAFSNVSCDPNPVFVWRSLSLPSWVSAPLSTLLFHDVTSIAWAPFQLHTIVMAIFASLVAPFGGFFASGFKRAFNLKDFGDSIPGHGGMTDRMDCQFLMGMFAYVYYSSLIRTNTVTVVGLLHTITTSLSTEDQKLLLHALQRVVAKSH